MEEKPYLRSITVDAPEERRNTYPFVIPGIRNLATLDFHADITFFVGENGSGKSTLLEAIAAAMNLGAQGGTGNFFMEDEGGSSGLDRYLKIKKSFVRPKDRYFLRAESFYNIATYLEDLADDPDARTSRAEVFRRYGGKELHRWSHGESFMTLLTKALGGKGFYIFDEPEAALSPSRQLAAMVQIHELVKRQSQFIIATHSPILMSLPGARIYLMDEAGCREVAFEETEHYKVTRDFLNNYPKRLEQLLSDE